MFKYSRAVCGNCLALFFKNLKQVGNALKAGFKLAICQLRFENQLCLFPDNCKQFVVKFANQNFPFVRIFVFRETAKFLFTLQMRQLAYILLQKVLQGVN